MEDMSASGDCTPAASIVARIGDPRGSATSRRLAIWRIMGVINIILQPKSKVVQAT